MPMRIVLIALYLCCAVAAQAQSLPNLPVLDSLPEEEVRAYVSQLSANADALRKQQVDRVSEVNTEQMLAESTLENAKQDTTTAKEDLKAAQKVFKTAQKKQKNEQKRLQSIEAIWKDIEQLQGADIAAQRKSTPKLWVRLQKMQPVAETPSTEQPVAPSDESNGEKKPRTKRKPKKSAEPIAEQPVANIISASEKPIQGQTAPNDIASAPEKTKKAKKTKRPAPTDHADDGSGDAAVPAAASADSFAQTKPKTRVKLGKRPKTTAPAADSTGTPAKETQTLNTTPDAYRAYNPAEDVMLHPPGPSCAFLVDTRDEFSGELRRETARYELFRHTNPALKRAMQGKSHVVCQASLGNVGAQTYLYLHFTVNDPNAPRTLGSLPRNGVAIVKFLDGNTFNLYNASPDDGKAEFNGQAWVFRGQYPIDKNLLRKIRTDELDKIRLAWANGYEDYDVHDIRLLMGLVKCMEKG